MTERLHVSPNGRIVIPTKIRQKLGVQKGGTVVIDDSGDQIILTSGRQALDDLFAQAEKRNKENRPGRINTPFNRERDAYGIED
jgi:AbrB family looped-hinge helix DNA binding protein